MKKLFASLAVALSLVFAPVQKSEAAVGLVAAPAIVVVGGIVAAAGGIAFVDGWVGGPICKAKVFDGVLSCIIIGISGMIVGAIGLVILDGDQTVAFSEVDSSMGHLKGISAEDIAIYNSELDQLNAINAEITAEVAADKNTDARARWTEMGEFLSPATMKIAALNGQLLLKSLK